jgi:hypothetical protein
MNDVMESTLIYEQIQADLKKGNDSATRYSSVW